MTTTTPTLPTVLDKARLIFEGYSRHDADRIMAAIGHKTAADARKWYVRREKLDAWIAKREGGNG